jgi:hypothetical protein
MSESRSRSAAVGDGGASARLDDLRAQAEYARQRYQLYKAKSYGLRPTSTVRMRELERAFDRAQARVQAAEAEARRPSDRQSGPPTLR